MLNSDSTIVVEALKATKERYPEYYSKLIQKRLAGSSESHYPMYKTPQELERALISFEWNQTIHTNVPDGQLIFETYLAGNMAYVYIHDEPEGTLFDVRDYYGSGKLFLTIQNRPYQITPITYLTTRKDQNKNIVVDFHPGPPLRNFIINMEEIISLSFISRAKALDMGFEWARIE